ncbi:MAG: riboflavin synthase [Candidatus Omnitrophica bacterium]|nr:riboflavin synthase [Candidatus Omnitrophota bacterium]
MFTGIIEEIGRVKSLNETEAIYRLRIKAPKVSSSLQPGASVCVNGACLTVVQVKEDDLNLEVMAETIRCTNLGQLSGGDCVNLERALKADGRIDGHFVSGHVDGTGILSKKIIQGTDVFMQFKAPEEILRYITLKGSVAIDGVSLSVSHLDHSSFGVSLIPFTLKNSILDQKKIGASVNIECDILAKYIERFSQKRPKQSSITPSFLKEHGYI